MRSWSLLMLASLVVGLLILSSASVVFALAGWNKSGHNLAGWNLAGWNGVQMNTSSSAKSTGFVLDGFKVVDGRLIVGQ